MAVLELAKGNENYDPMKTSTDVFARQSFTKQAAENHVYVLTFNGEKQPPIVARDDNEAWAKFCDGRKQYPSRRRSNVQIKDLGPVSKVQAAREAAETERLAATESKAAGDIAGKLESLGV